MLGFLGFKSGHSANYTISSEPAFHAGAWAVHNATRRTTNDPVSVFTFDKKKFESFCSKNGLKNSKGSDEIYSRLRNEATNLARLRHPHFLRIVEPLYEGKSSLSFVTERVETCIRSKVETDASRDSRSTRDHIPPELSPLVIQKGLLQVSEGLRFMHEDAKMVHMNLNLNTVFVDSFGDWKIGGCGYACEVSGSETRDFFIPQFDARYPRFVQINLDYAAPELVLDKNLDFSADVFSLACLAITLYNFKSPIDSNNNYNNYEEDVKALASFLKKPNNTSKIPATLVEILPKLLTRYPTDRYPIQGVLSANYFNSFLLKSLKFIDEFSGKTDEEVEAFIPQFIKIIPEFPFEILKNKILKVLIGSLSHVNEAIMASLLHVIFLISAQLSSLDFCKIILPILSGNEKLQQNSDVQKVVLEDLDIFLKNLNSKEIEKTILPFFFIMFDNAGAPEVQEAALFKCQKDILEKLDFPIIKNKIFPKIGEVFTKTTSLGVKIAAINALKELCVSGLDKHSVTDKLLGMLKAVKSRDPRVMMAMLSLYETLVKMLDVEVIANEVIPVLWSMAVGPKYTVAQFEQFMTCIKQFSTKVETEQKKKLTNNVEVPMASKEDFSSGIVGMNSAMGGVTLEPTKPTNDFMLDDGPSFTAPAPVVQPKPSIPASIPALQAPKKQNDDFGSFASANSSNNSFGNFQSSIKPLPAKPSIPSLQPLQPQPLQSQTLTPSKPTSTANYNINTGSTSGGINWNSGSSNTNTASSGINWNTNSNSNTGSGINWNSNSNSNTTSNWNNNSMGNMNSMNSNTDGSINWNTNSNANTNTNSGMNSNTNWNASSANNNNSDSLL
ncbi:Protein kinase-like protein SCY1 [Yarrowia sp. B02]|nr:Protein kinase-like protein SCY1 [Yarrowia sp. B02]